MSSVFTKKDFDEACDASEGSLPLKLQQVAVEELGETPAKRREALNKLRQLLEGSWVLDEVSYLDLHRAGLFCLEHLARDPAAQVLGIVLLVDYGGFTVDKLLYVSISLIRKGLEYLQDCMPMRLKVAHNVRQSYAFDMFLTLTRPFIKQKLAERIRLHGHNFESLHAEISPMALPEEYGGQRPPLDPEECWKAVDADKDYFVACSRYGYATNDEGGLPAEPEPQLQLTSL
ncbi:clavesin-2 [Rhipicephalus sanguineus]|uniref:clavesin-2 n=1 Tax=Rhipicephalus sanguineus TaxID=34632 RepID=UPI0020C25D08|nr:clavesin-2 [Rhipicephalus sanguineus]